MVRIRLPLAAAAVAAAAVAAGLLSAPAAAAATPATYSCEEDGSYSVEVCTYMYGYTSGSSFVLDHYGAKIIRHSSQARSLSGTITVGIAGRAASMPVSSASFGVEYSFRPPWAGQAVRVDATGHAYQCGHSVFRWARGTGTYSTTSGNAARGNCDTFGDGGDGFAALPAAPASLVSPGSAAALRAGDAIRADGGALLGTVRQVAGPPRAVTVDGRAMTAVSVVVGVVPPGGAAPAALAGSCTNDSSFSVSLCVDQYYTRSGEYVAVDHYTLTASRSDSQARLVGSRLRAGVLGACKPGSCTGTKNDTQDFTQNPPGPDVPYNYYPRWHGLFTQTAKGRYQCANAWLDWARGTARYQISMVPAVCQGSVS